MIFVSTVCAAQETLSHQNYFRLSYRIHWEWNGLTKLILVLILVYM